MLTAPRITASATRTLRRRILAVLALGAFTLAGVAEATGVSPCPHHDDGGAHHREHQSATHHQTHGAPSGHSHDHAGDADAHGESCDHADHVDGASPADPHGSAPPCDCEAGCALAMQAVALSSVAAAAAIADQSTTAGFVVGVQADLPGPSPFTLPYATAPPRD